MNIWRLVSPGEQPGVILSSHHHHWICLLAVVVAILAASVLLPVTHRFHAGSARGRYVWLVAGSVGMGIGIWAMHFTSMLALSLPIPIHFDLVITMTSMLPAILASGYCIMFYQPDQCTHRQLQIAALTMAVGIGSMHYIGMEAIVVAGNMYYVPEYFFLSLVAAYFLALAALFIRSKLSSTSRRNIHPYVIKALGNIVLGLAVSSMHFIAMYATYFQASDIQPDVHHTIAPYALVFGIVTATLLLLSMIVIGIIVDRRLALMADSLKESEMRFQQLAESTQTAIFTFNEHHVIYANPALSQITGYSHADLTALPLNKVFGDDITAFAQQILEPASTNDQALYQQFEMQTTNGETRWIYLSLTQANIDHRVVGLASACDITEQKRAELAMRQLAYSDPLTGLANRAMFMDRLNHHLRRLARRDHDSLSCVMLLDLDNFKSINDSHGHQHGDKLLIEVAQRLTSIARDSDTAARFGGDEFILLFEDLDALHNISTIAERILASLSAPLWLNGRLLSINASIGVLTLDENVYYDADDVLRDVDIALYRAKQTALASWTLFDQHLDATAKRHRLLEAELKQAIATKELHLYYQPIVEAGSYEICGFEGLARWRRKNGEWVSPAEFIPIAEQSGVIADIGLWALETAAQQLAKWNRDMADQPLYVSVNIAAVSFGDDRFYRKIADLFATYQFKNGQLKLELTERMLMDDTDSMVMKLQNLIDLGCEIMIDDFGTGYSSLSYLHKLPIRTVKIDQSFVAELISTGHTAPIIKSIIALAQSLNMDVVSEGVETLEQAQRLTELGSNQMQGYFFGRPVPLEATEQYLLAKSASEKL